MPYLSSFVDAYSNADVKNGTASSHAPYLLRQSIIIIYTNSEKHIPIL